MRKILEGWGFLSSRCCRLGPIVASEVGPRCRLRAAASEARGLPGAHSPVDTHFPISQAASNPPPTRFKSSTSPSRTDAHARPRNDILISKRLRPATISRSGSSGQNTSPSQSGATLERPGMDHVRDLVAAGGVSVVLAQDRDRFAREPAYLYPLRKEFEEHGAANCER
jgi:hypothetical protein